MYLRIASWLLVLAAGGDGGREASQRMAPAWWRGNPWGPAAQQARLDGRLPQVILSPRLRQWDAWGRTALRDGDIVFRMGDARILFGRFPISKFLANASGSRYSHTGIVAHEGGELVVYDTSSDGTQRQPFGVWMADCVGAFGAKRPKPAVRDRIPAVLAYCRRVYAEQVPFDYELGLGDEALYCVEMTEKAYRAAGLKLSEPVRLGDMEHAAEKPLPILAIQYCSQWTLVHPLTLEHRVFFPGNERHGIWSSPYLETVYPTTPPAVATGAAVKATARQR